MRSISFPSDSALALPFHCHSRHENKPHHEDKENSSVFTSEKNAQELMKDNKDHRLIYLKIQSELNAGAIVHENVKKWKSNETENTRSRFTENMSRCTKHHPMHRFHRNSMLRTLEKHDENTMACRVAQKSETSSLAEGGNSKKMIFSRGWLWSASSMPLTRKPRLAAGIAVALHTDRHVVARQRVFQWWREKRLWAWHPKS